MAFSSTDATIIDKALPDTQKVSLGTEVKANQDNITTNAAAIALQKSESGIPFYKAVTLTSAAANTNVDILTSAEVIAMKSGGVVVVTSLLLKVNGATAWTDSTGTVVTIQDKAGSPVLGASYAKAQLTGNAILNLTDTGLTLSAPISTGVGFTADKGIDIVADSDFDAGSDIVVSISGYVI